VTELDDSLVDGVGRENDRVRPDRAMSSADARLLALEREAGARDSESMSVVSANELTRRGRVKKWNRPPPPHDWRWWIGNLGKTLIALGLLMFGFVAYQLWGTGIETARAQNALESDFEELLAAAPAIDPTLATEPVVTTEPAEPTASDITADPDPVEVLPVAAQNIPEVERGDALARIEIPSIGVDDIVVAGVKTSDLKKGPGHFPETPLPGQLGNSAIAGHRTTYGQPFHNVDKLEPGDEIIVTTLSGTFVYRVTGQQIVAPSAGEVVATTDPTRATLTLTSCHPKWTARERIVISSELDTAASSIVGEPVINYGQPLPAAEPADEADEIRPADDGTTAPGPEPAPGVSETPAAPATVGVEALGSAAVTQGIADAFAEGWFSDPAANPHVGFWGVLLALVGIGSYLISRRFRRDWLGAIVGLLPFLVTLYFFFQNVNRLLPPNL
jgi:sortase A